MPCSRKRPFAVLRGPSVIRVWLPDEEGSDTYGEGRLGRDQGASRTDEWLYLSPPAVDP